MGDPIRLQFRPSLIIFVGEAGALIRDHLSPTTLDKDRKIVANYLNSTALLASLDEPLRQGVGLLHVYKDVNKALRAAPLPTGMDFLKDKVEPKEEGPFEELLQLALRSVGWGRRRRAFADAGYRVRDPRPQIYIVGDAADSADLSQVLQVVRKQVRKYGFDTLICYVLNSFDATPKSRTSSLSYIPTDWSQRAVANYCYLYEDMERHPDLEFITQAEAYYAAAEAIFAYIATGITLSDSFIDYTKVPNLGNYENVGTLSTSLIIFPRAAIQRYCSDQLGSALIQQWITDLQNAVISDAARKAQQNNAARDVEKIENWLQDRQRRPGTDASKCPSLVILTERIPMQPPRDDYTQEEVEQRHQAERQREQLENKQKNLFNDRLDQTRALFKLFSEAEVADAYRFRQYKSDTWTGIAYDRAGKAVNAFGTWDMASRTAWEAAGKRVSANVQHTVDQLWPNPNNGFELARVYIDQFDQQLSTLSDSLSSARIAHDRSYREAMDKFAEIAAEGEWANQPSTISGSGNATGITSARPTMGNYNPGGGAATVQKSSFIGGSMPSQSAYQHLPKYEERIAGLLEQRIAWKQRQVPVVWSQGAASLAFLLSLGLLGQAVLPHVLKTLPLLTLPVLLVLTLVIGGNLLFRRDRQQHVKVAQRDFLKFYRLYYAHLCERREDEQRRLVMGPLRRRVLRIRERLDDMYGFLREVRKRLEDDAEQTRDNLFDGPASSRDIFIGNGERLQKEDPHTPNREKEGTVTLSDFAEKVTLQRVREPIELWHRDLEEIRNALIRELQRTESIIEMSEERARQYIASFTQRIIEKYLTGELVDIEGALGRPEIWRKVVERIQRPLYSASVGIRDPHIYFVCGSEEHMARGRKYIPAGTIPVSCATPEWLLMAAFYRSGESSILNTDLLFPSTMASASVSTSTSFASQLSPGMVMVNNGASMIKAASNVHEQKDVTSVQKLDDDDDDVIPFPKFEDEEEDDDDEDDLISFSRFADEEEDDDAQFLSSQRGSAEEKKDETIKRPR